MKALRLIVLGAACIGISAFASPVIDQEQALHDGGFAIIVPTYDGFQTFQQSANNISGGGFFLGSSWGSGPATFSIGVFSDNPWTNPGSLLASGTGVGSPGDWVDAFWAPIDVSAYTLLYLSIASTDGGSVYASSYGFGYPVTPYAAGGAGFRTTPGYDTYYDLTFRTYSESTYGADVPDGGLSAVMFGAALAGLVTLRRKFARA